MEGSEANGQGDRGHKEPGLFSDSRLMRKKKSFSYKCLKIKITK